MNDLIKMTAREAVRRLKNKDVSPGELIDAALSRIAEVEPSVNALPTLCEDRARDFAAGLSGNPDRPGWLAGLPVAIKDMNEVGGVRTTYGSPIYADHVPEKSDITVAAMEARGATVLAKSNTPEFAAGANTFNEVFGKTRNPWNTALTCGGSSGGSAVALATGEVWLAGGSDLGGSLRTPAAFCSVVGYRPSPGRVRRAGVNPFDTMGVNGPMARNIGDVGLLLDNMAGEDIADPISLPVPDVPYQASAESPRPPKRVAFTRDFGFLPVAAEIKEIAAGAASRLEELGARGGGDPSRPEGRPGDLSNHPGGRVRRRNGGIDRTAPGPDQARNNLERGKRAGALTGRDRPGHRRARGPLPAHRFLLRRFRSPGCADDTGFAV